MSRNALLGPPYQYGSPKGHWIRTMRGKEANYIPEPQLHKALSFCSAFDSILFQEYAISPALLLVTKIRLITNAVIPEPTRYDELSDHGYNSLPKRYQKSDGLQGHLCWVGDRRHES